MEKQNLIHPFDVTKIAIKFNVAKNEPEIFLFSVLFQVCFACFTEFVVPFFSETADERFLQKLVEADVFFPSQNFGSLAYFPSVVVDRSELRIFYQTNRVKVARNGLVVVDAPFAVGFFDGTIAHAVVAVTGEYAIFPVDNGGYEVAFFVDISYSLLFDDFLSLRQQVVPYFRKYFLYFFIFLFADGRASIAFNAAFAEAFVEVTAKKLFDKVKADQSIANL